MQPVDNICVVYYYSEALLTQSCASLLKDNMHRYMLTAKIFRKQRVKVVFAYMMYTNLILKISSNVK